jgi:Domain of unknown function (DUF4439)
VTTLQALQAVLAGEHAAVYAYGVVGGRLAADPGEAMARSGYDTHRQRRAAVTALIVAAGAQPVAAAAAYALGAPASTPPQARELAAAVEQRAAATYAGLVAVSSGAVRATAAAWLADAAVRQAGWSGHADTFPGLANPAT